MMNLARFGSAFQSDLRVQDLLFRATPRLGYVYTAPPVAVACFSSVISLILLFIPAYLLQIAHIPSHRGDVGFIAKKNWSLMYSLFLPVFLALAGLACRTIYSAVCRFISPGQAVIFDQDDNVATRYPDDLAEMMSKRGGTLAICSAVLALLVTLTDTYDLWPGFFTGRFPDSRVAEWDTAFRILTRPPVFHWEIFYFDVVAYVFQTGYIFIAIFFCLTCWSFLLAIASILDESRPPFRLKPVICDFRKRLGLAPLAWVFHWLLFLGIGFGAFAAVHRFQEVDTLRQHESWTYLRSLFHNAPATGTEGSSTTEHGFSLAAALNLARQDYAIKELMNPSSWLSIVFIALPGTVVCILPLGRIYQYVCRTRDKLMDENTQAYDLAVRQGDIGTAFRLKTQLECLREANIWPNGDTVAWTCLILLIGVLIVSIAPPLLPFALSAGAIPALYGFFTANSRRS